LAFLAVVSLKKQQRELMSSSSSLAVALEKCPQERPGSSSWSQKFLQDTLLCVLLSAVVFLCFASVSKNGFVNFDDDTYITDNPQVHAGLSWKTLKWAFTTYREGNWHPLTWLSHALDWQLFGLNPAGHHYMNVGLHALNAMVLFLLLQYATGYRWRSLMVAALFAVHPMNVESVAWAAERKNVLSMLVFLLGLYAYTWYARRPAISRYLTVVGLFILSLLSKPQVITFPCLLILWDFWPLDRFHAVMPEGEFGPANRLRSIGNLLVEKIPLFALSAISAVITVKAQTAGGAVKSFSEYGTTLRAENAIISYVRYVAKFFWPAKLADLYPHPTNLYAAWQVVAASLGLLLITAIVLMRLRKQRYMAIGWFWFVGSLVPMAGLLQVGLQSMADRYAYIPFIGLFLILVWTAADWARARHLSVLWLTSISVCYVLALGIITHKQIGYWHDSATLWRHALAVTKENYVAESNLGETLLGQGKDDEAAAHFRAALAVRPEGTVANLDLGSYEDRRGNFADAIKHYRVVVDHSKDAGMSATAYGSLGFVYREMGEPAKAKQSFETSIQLDGSRARARIGLGLVAQDAGDIDEAVRQFSIAAALQNSDIVNLLLANALDRAGHREQAKAIYGRLGGSPNLPEAEREARELLSRK
jgi:tetratricopeptide (TPR) repeat protein